MPNVASETILRPPAGASAGLLPNTELHSRGWQSNICVFPTCTFLNSTFPSWWRKPASHIFLRRHSDEEDDVVGHHDLVVVLHAAQGAADLGLREVALAALVDAVHQGGHLDRLSVSRLEDGKQ